MGWSRRKRIDAARFISELLAHRARTSSGADVQIAVIDAVTQLLGGATRVFDVHGLPLAIP